MRHPNSIFNFVRLPDIISLGNGLSGTMSIYFSINGKFVYAAVMIAIGAVCDLFDGKVARNMNLSSEFGKQIDSLCDLVSFIVAPAVFAYSVGLQQPWFLAIEAFFILAGIMRLSRFNVTGTTDEGKFFEGVPVPVSIGVVALFFLFSYFRIPIEIWGGLFLLHAVLMISTVKIPKL